MIRPEVQVPAIMAQAADQAYSVEHGSIVDEMIARADHAHGLWSWDNLKVYLKLEEATRSTSYYDSIKTFSRAKNGRGAFLALIAQYAGTDK